MKRLVLFALLLGLAMLSAVPAALAEEASAPEERQRPHGILSHGDSSAFLEDFFGGRVERAPPEAPKAARKHDPAIRWEGSGSTAR